MNNKRNIAIILDNIDDSLHVELSILKIKVFQYGQQLTRHKVKAGGEQYKVETTDGGDNIIIIKGSLINGRQIEFRGETINLDAPLSKLGLIISSIPGIVLLLAVCLTVGFLQLGAIGGGLLGGIGFMSIYVTANFVRNEKEFAKQIMYSTLMTIATPVLFFILLLIFGLIFGGLFSIF